MKESKAGETVWRCARLGLAMTVCICVALHHVKTWLLVSYIAVQTVVAGKLLLVHLPTAHKFLAKSASLHLKITSLPLIFLCKIKLCVTYELSIK
jgi:hypothetical protein